MAGPIKLDEVTRGLFIAWRLFLWDGKAVALIDDSRGGAFRSFWCAAVVLPLVFANWALQAATTPKVPGNFGLLAEHAGLPRTLTVLAIFYVIQWTAWPVLMYWLTRLLNCERFYFRYLAARNWSAAILGSLTVLFAVVHFSGIAPWGSMRLVSLAFLAVMWAYHWFILRATLEINGGFAAVLVAADFSLSVVTDQIGIAVTM